jgi:cell division protein ZapA
MQFGIINAEEVALRRDNSGRVYLSGLSGGAFMSKVKTTVRIGGKEYTMSGNDSEEYIHRVAIYVDRKMSQIEESNNNLSTTMLAVLTCLNIADELLKLREQTDGMRQQVESYRKQVEALTRQQELNATEMNRLQKENILLREARQSAPPRRN